MLLYLSNIYRLHTDPIIEDLLYDESNGEEVVINELIDVINFHRNLHHVARERSKITGDNGNSSTMMGSKRRRSPSMLADGFGFVTEERVAPLKISYHGY